MTLHLGKQRKLADCEAYPLIGREIGDKVKFDAFYGSSRPNMPNHGRIVEVRGDGKAYLLDIGVVVKESDIIK